ncbi:MAG TPA: ABC-F family ATP-binding cassette domain-containing protein [Gammaproteobacteria bacterium]|nr:ABC-F family ATP-binding cassette domain-containing protein [Gammaproteobacteria bacterium]
MLDIRDLSLNFGQRILFKDVDLMLLPNQRYGVVGPNGAGKSTFLRLLAGEETPNEGTVDKPKTMTVGILKQDHFLYEHDRVVDVVIKGNTELWAAQVEKEHLLHKPHLTEEDGYRLGTLEEIILHHEGYDAEAVAQRLLVGLGISEKYHFGPLNALSGGYKLRVLLAQVLFQKPDIMLLDEPTNHLDIVSIDWLEDFLIQEFKGLLVFVSHDREFLNNLSTHILDVDYKTITEYPGNYDYFLKAKEETLRLLQQELQHKEKQIAHLQSFVDRFRASANRSRQAQSRLKMIERIELPDIKDSEIMKPFFRLQPEKPSGKTVLKVEHIGKQFDERVLLKDIAFSLQRGDKCAVIGANGIGKSTLLKILLQEVKADHGHYEWSETVKVGYFAQDYRVQLPKEVTVWEWLENRVNAPSQEIRNVLGQVLFRGQDVEKKIAVLSGGESARLVLASLILQKNNVLVLDEPTNHLDMESIEALMEALHKFPGAVLFVSHNRYFIDHVATRVIALTEKGGVRNYLGNYHDYLAQYGKDYLARIGSPR